MAQSEFGKGLVYCLGLFLAHAERFKEMRETKDNTKLNHVMKMGPDMWFNGAADHLQELETGTLPSPLKERAEALRVNAIKRGRGYIKRLNEEGHTNGNTWKHVDEAINEAYEILMEIDKLHGVPTDEAQWK